MATGRDALAGLRILIVEDEFLVAMLVEEMLQDLRCEIVGPVSTLEEAVATVRQNRLDGALLDANLNGKNSSPVADELLGHEVPFILEDRQIIGRLVFERLSEIPDVLYGQTPTSNYQGQGLKLSKHFLT